MNLSTKMIHISVHFYGLHQIEAHNFTYAIAEENQLHNSNSIHAVLLSKHVELQIWRSSWTWKVLTQIQKKNLIRLINAAREDKAIGIQSHDSEIYDDQQYSEDGQEENEARNK